MLSIETIQRIIFFIWIWVLGISITSVIETFYPRISININNYIKNNKSKIYLFIFAVFLIYLGIKIINPSAPNQINGIILTIAGIVTLMQFFKIK